MQLGAEPLRDGGKLVIALQGKPPRLFAVPHDPDECAPALIAVENLDEQFRAGIGFVGCDVTRRALRCAGVKLNAGRCFLWP